MQNRVGIREHTLPDMLVGMCGGGSSKRMLHVYRIDVSRVSPRSPQARPHAHCSAHRIRPADTVDRNKAAHTSPVVVKFITFIIDLSQVDTR